MSDRFVVTDDVMLASASGSSPMTTPPTPPLSSPVYSTSPALITWNSPAQRLFKCLTACGLYECYDCICQTKEVTNIGKEVCHFLLSTSTVLV